MNVASESSWKFAYNNCSLSRDRFIRLVSFVLLHHQTPPEWDSTEFLRGCSQNSNEKFILDFARLNNFSSSSSSDLPWSRLWNPTCKLIIRPGRLLFFNNSSFTFFPQVHEIHKTFTYVLTRVSLFFFLIRVV